MSEHSTQPIVIIGAGLAGCSVALELAGRGHEVSLIDQDPVPMNRASLRNEGKIHLGLCYANDATLETAKLQLQGALTFRSLLSRWIGENALDLSVSTPFVYAVARNSLLSPDDLQRRYAAIESICISMLASDPNLDYLGKRPSRLFEEIDVRHAAGNFSPENVPAAFVTEELAVDPARLAAHLHEAIRRRPEITFHPGVRIERILPAGENFSLEGTRESDHWTAEARQVVNATWESRMALDRTVGLPSDGDWLLRLKYRVLGRLPHRMRGATSVTMVLGRFGDVVVRENGTVYLSWYPNCLQGWTHEPVPPATWDGPCRGMPARSVARRIARDVVEAIDVWYPGIREVEVSHVDAGVIVAKGATDVDHLSSRLHTRTEVGVRSSGGYHSFNPGKLTTAPLLAQVAADRVEAAMAGTFPESVSL